MSTLSQLAWIAFLIAGFFCFAYLWIDLLRVWSDKSLLWRDRISLLALILASGAVLLRFVMPAFWGSDFGGQVRTAVGWTRVSAGMCVLALVLGLVGGHASSCPLSWRVSRLLGFG